MPGNSRPTVPSRAVDRRVDRHHRRGLGHAEAFDDLGAEALAPDAPRLGLHRLGAGNDKPQAGEIAVLGRCAHSR